MMQPYLDDRGRVALGSNYALTPVLIPNDHLDFREAAVCIDRRTAYLGWVFVGHQHEEAMAMEKIERLLGALSREELRRLELYLSSDYFPVRKGVRTFGLHYLRARRKQGWDALPPHKKWRLVMKGAYHDGNWRKLKSELASEVERFWVQEARRGHETELQATVVLLTELNRRRLDQDFEATFDRATKADLEDRAASWSDLLEGVRFWEVAYNYWVGRQDPNAAGEHEADLLARRMNAFERFVTFDYLKTGTCIENNRQMRRSGYKLILPPYFSAMLDAQRDVPNFLIQAYIHLFDVLQEEHVADLQSFLGIISPALQTVALDEAALLFDYAVNLFIRRYLIHPTLENADGLFALYQVGLARDLLEYPRGKLNVQHLKNICVLACRLGRVQFAKDFLASNRFKIVPSEDVHPILGYCDCHILFFEGKFRRCARLLSTLAAESYLKIEIRILEIKAHYELGEFDVVDLKLDNFDRFLQRSPLPEGRLRPFLDRIRLLRKIRGLKEVDKKQIQIIRGLIQNREILDAEWLLDILERKENGPIQ